MKCQGLSKIERISTLPFGRDETVHRNLFAAHPHEFPRLAYIYGKAKGILALLSGIMAFAKSLDKKVMSC
jgi:hypothetical protein